MDGQELTLIGFWVIPCGTVPYLSSDHTIHVEFQNNTKDPIIITQVTCSFETEDPVLASMASVSKPHLIPPRNMLPLRMSLPTDLTLKAGTNTSTVKAEYSVGGSPSKVITFGKQPNCHAIFSFIPVHNQYFFISHKDPENTEISKRLDYYLRKIGFSGYLAEEDRQPGLNFWDEKILPSIANCMGLIVMWTEVASSSQKIYDEIKYAQDQNIRIIPLVEKTLDLPDIIQEQNEYMSTNDKITEYDLVKLVNSLYNEYTRGVFSTS